MGIFSSIFRGRDRPVDRTTGSAYSFFPGNSTSGKQVNEWSSMQECICPAGESGEYSAQEPFENHV